MAVVLGLAGSPRRGGNTDMLLREVLRGAQESGAKSEFVPLRELTMRPCIECLRCETTGRCVVQDDALAVHQKLIEADHLVFATPIFFVAVSAHSKILIDRCQCFWSLKHVLRKPLFETPRPHRQGLFVSVCGFDKRWMFDGARRTMKALFSVLEFKYAGELCYEHIDGRGDILEHPAAMAEAYQVGKALATGQPLPSPPG